jgi:hypothetical protein
MFRRERRSVPKNAVATFATSFSVGVVLIAAFGATGGCNSVLGLKETTLFPIDAYDCFCRCTSSKPTVHIAMSACLPDSLNSTNHPTPLTQMDLDTDCGGRIQAKIDGAMKQCVTSSNGINCSCFAGPIVSMFRSNGECQTPCPSQDIDPTCSNFNPFSSPPVKTATNVPGQPPVCIVATSDPPAPTPEPLTAGILGRVSNCTVSGNVTIAAGSNSQTRTATGVVNITGAPCAGASCPVGMSYRIDHIDDFSFDSLGGFASVKVHELFASGATIPAGATLDAAGNGTFGPGTTQSLGTGRRTDQIALGIVFDDERGAFSGPNANPLAIGVQWQNHVCGVNGALLGQLVGADTTGSADLTGTIVNEPPSANAGAPQTIECTSPAGSPIALDGSGSTDPENNIALFVWRQGSRLGQEIGDDQTISVGQALGGSQAYFLKVVDELGQSSEASTTVSVVDTTPPVVSSVVASPNELWPPNGKLIPIQVAVSATDTCDPNPVCKLTQITSNEPIEPEDAQITGPLTASLSARRLGHGSGRVYDLTVQCADASGNVATATTTVSVAHDQR